VTDCLAVIDSFHIRTVDWIGTSMGGIIGMIIAAKFPTRIRKLVLNDVGIHLPAAALERIYTYLRNMPREFTSREAADRYLARIFEPFGITDPELWRAFVDHSLLTGGATLKLACDPAIVELFRRDTKEFTDIAAVNLAEFWEAVRQPTFILWGETSDLLNAEIVRSMKATHPRAESLMIPKVGHAPALMTDDQIRPVVNFLVPQGLGI
jgi:pimeloyl-ACP methyl ester carboxylesterase